MVHFGEYQNPVRFSNDAADEFINLLRKVAHEISQFEVTRASAQVLASERFSGYFSEVFARNMRICSADAKSLQESLNKAADQVAYIKEQAVKENKRRQLVREYFARHDDWWEKGWDWLVGQEEPPHLPPAEPPVSSVTAHVTNNREQDLHKGPSRGVSSAIPKNLTDASGKLHSANENMVKGSQLSSCYYKFAASCDYGSLDVGDLFRKLDSWLNLNQNDVRWLRIVGDSFAAAGSDHGISRLADSAIVQALKSHNVNADRTDLDITSPTLSGIDLKTGYIDDPVNSATGNFVEPELDLGFAGLATGLGLSRLYNSVGALEGRLGVFGLGWSSVLDQRLELTDGSVGWVMADGRLVAFELGGDGPVRTVQDSFWVERVSVTGLRDGWLKARVVDAAGWDARVWVVSDNRGGQWWFSEAGLWLGACRGVGLGVLVERDGAGRVCGLLGERGRFMRVSYSAAGLVERAWASDGRTVSFVYDQDSHLVRADGPMGSREYVWDGALIVRVVDAAGVVECVNSYDEQGRVTGQVTEFGRRVRYAYLPGNVTVVSDEDGGRANTWIADAFGRTVGVIDSDDQRQSMSYDRWGNLVMVRGRDGNKTVRFYDERSHLVREVLPSKAEVSYRWDEFDRITEVATSNGSQVRYEYADDSCLNPSRIIDPVGGVTTLSWRAGLLESVTDPEGVRIDFSYDRYGDLVSVTNGEGAVAALERDSMGRVAKTISPLGFVSEFSYTDSGLLEGFIDAEGGQWRYFYDGAGRLVKSTDPTGVEQSFEYGSHGRLVRSVDGLGQATLQEFDDLGNVRAVQLPDGAEYLFAYDGLSRLQSITDPVGSAWSYEWDKQGNLTGVVDPEGVKAKVTGSPDVGRVTSRDSAGLVEGIVEFDEFGRPVKSVDPSGDAQIITYNQAGQPVELLDADGGLTVLGRDLAGRVISHTSPQGLVTSYAYDSCGRLHTVTVPGGGVYRCEYDADSRLVKVVDPVGDESTYVYDRVGRLLKANIAGQGVVERRYDKAGRLVFARDSLTGPRWFKYDKAGQLVKATNGLGGSSRYQYDAVGRLVKMVDPAGGTHTYVYDRVGQLIQMVDPLGNTIRAEYDKAGRISAMVDAEGTEYAYVYDANGRLSEAYANGRLLSKVETDTVKRTVTLFDYTNADSADPTTHTLVFTRLGQLASKTTSSKSGGQRKAQWFYDRDGRRVKYVSESGSETSYGYDEAGNLSRIDHPLLGRAVFSYDKSGQLTKITSGDSSQEWVWDKGFITKHSTNRPGEASDVTLISRDVFGRVSGLKTTSEAIEYAYDDASQLTGMCSTSGQAREWVYDQAGRLITSRRSAGCETVRESFSYNQASQLTHATTITTVGDDGQDIVETVYTYNQNGQRTSQENTKGQCTTYEWRENGYLGSISFAGSDSLAETKCLRVDALGYLTSIDDTSIEWDYASSVPTLTGVGLNPILSLPGGQYLTPASMVGHDLTQEIASWRPNCATDSLNPYAAVGGIPEYLVGDLPKGVNLSGGSLNINGLDWMGARVYDPATTSFLSHDPLPAPAGAMWEASPYNYAANNPLNLTDPHGLKPVTDQQIRDYGKTIDQRGFFGRAKENYWNWKTLFGIGTVALGGLLILTGVGGPAGAVMIGAALVGMGVDVATQQLYYGDVDWTDVSIGAVTGLVGGKIVDGAASGLAKIPSIKKAVQKALTFGTVPPIPKPAVSYGASYAKETVADAVSGGIGKAVNDGLGRESPSSYPKAIAYGAFSPSNMIARGINTGLTGPEVPHSNHLDHGAQLLKRSMHMSDTKIRRIGGTISVASLTGMSLLTNSLVSPAPNEIPLNKKLELPKLGFLPHDGTSLHWFATERQDLNICPVRDNLNSMIWLAEIQPNPEIPFQWKH